MCFRYEDLNEQNNNEVKNENETESPKEPVEFQIGDRVRVTKARGTRWMQLPATVVGFDPEDNFPMAYVLKIDNADSKEVQPRFFASSLERLPETAPVPPVTSLVEGYRVGDRVEVTYGFGWDGPGTITDVWKNEKSYSIKLDSGRHGTFYTNQFKRLEQTSAVFKGAGRVHVYAVAKSIAVATAKSKGQVTADQVQAELVKLGYTSGQLGNAAGSLFRGSSWRKIGTIKSERDGNNRREISKWQYIGA